MSNLVLSENNLKYPELMRMPEMNLEKFDLSSAPDFVFNEEMVSRIMEESREEEAILTLKEAGSWESATRLVLTD